MGVKLKNVIGAINKTHGKGSVSSARVIRRIPRISVGSLSFDRALGGGLAVGRVTIFAGEESSGKTTNALRAGGIAQKLCRNCYRQVDIQEFEEVDDGEGGVEGVPVAECDCYKSGLFKPMQYADEKVHDFKARLKGYEDNSYEEFRVALVDPEGTFDIDWGEKLGLDIDRLLYVKLDTAEETIDGYDALHRTGEVDMFILDSLAAMTPSEEVEASTENWQQGLQARLLGKFARKMVSSQSSVIKSFGRHPTHLWINQLRQKIGVSFGDNSVLPGGMAQKFASSTTVRMWASKWEREKRDEDLVAALQTESGVRVRMNMKTLKNKTAPAFQTGSYNMHVVGENAGHVDEMDYVIAMAKKFGLYREEGEGSGKKWYVGNDEVFKRKSEAMARMMEPKTFAVMRKIVLDKLLGNVVKNA